MPDAAQFARIASFLASYFSVLPLSEAAERLAAGTLPAAAACITFDDGYRDNLTVAAPILRRHDLPASLFVATAFLDGHCMWNDVVIEAIRAAPAGTLDLQDLGLGSIQIGDAASRVTTYQQLLLQLKYLEVGDRLERATEIARRAGLGSLTGLMLDPTELRPLRGQGWEIGGHTVSHPILARLDDASALREIGEGRERLTALLGEAPSTFAYPNGVPGVDFTDRDVALVRRAGFAVAVTTAPGANRRGIDPLRLKRFTPWDQAMTRFGARCALNLMRR